MSLASHQQRKGTVTWLTPPEWIKALGPFDLDPACPYKMPWNTAKMMYFGEGGLEKPWHGRVWLNPPFGREAELWVRNLATHGNGIALLHACTETAMYYESVWPKADAICFTRGRPHFHYENGARANFNSGAAIAPIAYGPENVEALRRADLGVVLSLVSATALKGKP